jgi:hypothetical protein
MTEIAQPVKHGGGCYMMADILAKIAAGHTINRINELMPWRMIPPAAAASAQPTSAT